jgi:hypothetical protein
MPAALLVDKDKVKTVALQIGVREAARQFELPEGTVQAWSKREGWFKQQAEAMEVVNGVKSLQPAATKSVSDVFLGYKGKTKLAQAKTVFKTAKAFSKLPAESLMVKTQEVKNNVDSAAKLWPEEQHGSQSVIAIQLNGYVPPPSYSTEG